MWRATRGYVEASSRCATGCWPHRPNTGQMPVLGAMGPTLAPKFNGREHGGQGGLPPHSFPAAIANRALRQDGTQNGTINQNFSRWNPLFSRTEMA